MSAVAHTAVALLQPGCAFFHCERCKLADAEAYSTCIQFSTPPKDRHELDTDSEQLLITQDLQVLKHQLWRPTVD